MSMLTAKEAQMTEWQIEQLIFDWNLEDQAPIYPQGVMITDETLRDGLQSPSIIHPPIQDKVYLLYLMNDLGIDSADIGLPGAGERFKYDVTVLAREIANHHLNIRPNCAARTLEADIIPIVEASQAAGIAIEAAVFIGSSPIRQYAEGWTVEWLQELTERAVTFAVHHGLPVMFVTEDTTRAYPDTLRCLYQTAIRCGAQRICVADTVGHATPEGTRALIRFIKEVVAETGADVGIDWHGHRDRGLSIPNTLAAIEAGATRVHACALGIGERSGNTPMEVLLVNLNLLGIANRDLSRLPEYCRVVAQTCGAPLPFNYPIVGADAFRTATGVHAAAVVKALERGNTWLADRVYSSIPASMVGRTQGIEIGPMSGEHNVRYWLRSRNIEVHPIYVEKILAAAKRSNHILPEDEIMRMVVTLRRRLADEAVSDEPGTQRA